MIEFVLIIIALHLVIVFIIDYTDAIDSLKRGLSRILTKGKIVKSDYSLKPFDCSLCANWWAGIILTVMFAMNGCFSIWMIVMAAMSAWLAGHTANIYRLIDNILTKLINYINERV